MDIELKYLASFHAVNREGGVAKGSRKLHLTQPAITYHIKMLEHSLGPLFERIGRKLILTPSGRILQEYCNTVFDEWERLRTEVKTGSARYQSELRISSVSTFGRYVVFPALMGKEFDQYRFLFSYREIGEIADALMSGGCDIGITAATKPTPLLSFEHLCDEEFILIAEADARWRGAELRKIGFYEARDFVTYEEGDFVFAKWFGAMFGRQPRMIRARWHVDEIEEVAQLVANGRGLSIVPAHAVARLVKEGTVRAIRPSPERHARNSIFIATRNTDCAKPSIGEVKRLIIEKIGRRN